MRWRLALGEPNLSSPAREAYPSCFCTILTLHSPLVAAAAFHVNFPAWGQMCGILRDSLILHYGYQKEDSFDGSTLPLLWHESGRHDLTHPVKSGFFSSTRCFCLDSCSCGIHCPGMHRHVCAPCPSPSPSVSLSFFLSFSLFLSLFFWIFLFLFLLHFFLSLSTLQLCGGFFPSIILFPFLPYHLVIASPR